MGAVTFLDLLLHSNTAQDAVGFPCHEGHCWLMMLLSGPPNPFLWSFFSLGQPPACTAVESYFIPDAGLCFDIFELHEVPVSPFLQPVKGPLSSSPTFQQVSNSP